MYFCIFLNVNSRFEVHGIKSNRSSRSILQGFQLFLDILFVLTSDVLLAIKHGLKLFVPLF